ncbi:hypothetical protein Zm00014a_010660 [Zea mays]|uniref:Agenet-like domain-containing protein n=1 Tax=Zea mays TaxID=4577 RepID=A0A3L6D7P3_MAIZE|nr:hypothetical protein Zm00014a_010660 [Zea mays]
MDLILPYKVGDLAESKSLVSGYRGAWFRCKIHNMRVRLGYLECYLEYIDYPGEKKEWVRLFRKNSARSNQNSSDSIHTMIRPSFPKWYFVHEVPEQFPNSDVTAIVDETWQIGDRVDWLKEGCYWSGTITKIINEDLVEIFVHLSARMQMEKVGMLLVYFNIINLGSVGKKERERKQDFTLMPLPADYICCSSKESDDDNDDNDSCDARQTVCRASNTHEEAPGPMVPAPPSATNNAPSHTYQKDAAVASTEDLLKPGSTSKSPDPRHDAQASAQPAGTGVSMKPEPVIGVSTIKKEDSLTEGEVDGDTEECLEKLGAIKARLKYLMQGTRLEHERSATFRG